ncbi:permease [Mycobacteriaceae bacterium 1482268.1]|nr:permease [Mycobacteriaceae bacterium 1482268.1]
MALALGLVLGGLIGVLLGLMGGGGSILAVPALVYGIGLDVEQAIPISLIVVATASAVGVLPKVKAGQVQWRLAGIFAAAGIPATILGSAIGRHLPESALLIGFALVMVVAGIRMLADQGNTGTACEVRTGQVNWRRCAPRSIGAGLLVGLLTGLFGVGGGFLIIPALVVVLGVEMSTAIGTSLLIVTVNSVAGVIAHLHTISIDWSITSSFVVAAMGASLVAGLFGAKVNTARLQRWFAYLVFAVAAFVLVDTVFLR